MVNQTQIPSARVPITEGENNLISREWFRYFNNINTLAGGGAGLIPVSSGGTGLSTTPANGQLLIGNGTGYTLNTLSAGTNIAIANGSGNISVSFSGILSPSQGGTGSSTIPTIGSVLIGDGTNYTVGTVTAGPGLNVKSSSTAITVSLAGGAIPLMQDGQDVDGVDFYTFARPPITTAAAPSATYSTGSAVAVFHPDDTYGGYTVGQIVTALKVSGLLS